MAKGLHGAGPPADRDGNVIAVLLLVALVVFLLTIPSLGGFFDWLANPFSYR